MRPFWAPFVGNQWLMLLQRRLSEHPHRYDYRISNHPGLFGYDSSDPQSVTEYRAQFAQAAQRSALYPPPPPPPSKSTNVSTFLNVVR